MTYLKFSYDLVRCHHIVNLNDVLGSIRRSFDFVDNVVFINNGGCNECHSDDHHQQSFGMPNLFTDLHSSGSPTLWAYFLFSVCQSKCFPPFLILFIKKSYCWKVSHCYDAKYFSRQAHNYSPINCTLVLLFFFV